jgi:hypothetical protein
MLDCDVQLYMFMQNVQFCQFFLKNSVLSNICEVLHYQWKCGMCHSGGNGIHIVVVIRIPLSVHGYTK